MISKFRTFDDFFDFLELKRAEIEAEIELSMDNKVEDCDNKDIENFEMNPQNPDISNDINSNINLLNSQFQFQNHHHHNSSPKFSESEFIKMTPMRINESIYKSESDNCIPPHATNTTIILEKLNLNENESEEFDKLDFLTGIDDDFNVSNSDENIIVLEPDFDLDLDMLISQYEEKENLNLDNDNDVDLDSLSFSMSQFPGEFDVDCDSKLQVNNISLDLDLDLDQDDLDFDADDGEFNINLSDNKKIEDDKTEFDDLDDLSISQYPNTQGLISMTRDLNDSEIDKVDEIPYNSTNNNFIGFKTGKGVILPPPSNEALKRARSLVELDELKANDENLNDINNEVFEGSKSKKIPSSFPMFTTGHGKVLLPPSEEAMKRAKSIIELDQEIFDNDKNITMNLNTKSPMTALIPAFSTGRGKILVPPSEESLKRAVALINDNENINSYGNDNNFIASFSTGRGKVLEPPSEKAMKHAISLIGSVDNLSDNANNNNNNNNSNNNGIIAAFSTGRGKIIPAPSDEALKHARTIFNTDFKESFNSSFDGGDKTVAPVKIKVNSAFKPPSNIQSIVPKPFSFSTVWKRPRKPISKSTTTTPPKSKIEPISLFDLNVMGMQRFSLKDFFKTVPENQKFTLTDYTNRFQIVEEVLKLNSRTCKDFRIGEWGYKDAHSNLLELGAQAISISLEWTANHYRWIVWKFASLIRSFPDSYAPANLSPNYILQQLLYRYEREINKCQRSALKKIVERDDAGGKYLCLMVASVDLVNRSIELSDGWYSIWTSRLEDSFWELIEDRKRILEGTKIEICGASLTGQDALPVLDASAKTCACKFVIMRNCTRPARWDTKLGFMCKERTVAFLKHLHQLHPQGGQVPAISVIIDRVFPLLYKEQRNLDSENKEERVMISRNERDHYLYLETTNSEQAQNSKFTPLQRIRVVSDFKINTDPFYGIISFWNPLGEDQRQLLGEGSKVIFTNLRTKAKSGNNTLTLLSTKSTRIFKDTHKFNYSHNFKDHRIIELGQFEVLKDLKLHDSFDLTGIVLGRVGNYFWIGDRDNFNFDFENENKEFKNDYLDGVNNEKKINTNNTINIDNNQRPLVCLKNFNYQISTGDLINFRDLLFNQFDFKVKVAHFTFTEYSDFKKEKEKEFKNNYNNNVDNFILFKESLKRFKSLTE